MWRMEERAEKSEKRDKISTANWRARKRGKALGNREQYMRRESTKDVKETARYMKGVVQKTGF